MIPTYSIIVKDATGKTLGQFSSFQNLVFGKKLNNYGTCTFDVPMSDPKVNSLVVLRQYEVWIYRGSDLVWSGEMALRKKSKKANGDNWCTITAFDWFEQLNQVFTDEAVTFTGIDAGQITWDMINGAFGITKGTVTATMNRDRTYNNQNVMQAIIDLSNVINGFDFEINNEKVFNALPIIGIDRTNLILEYGANVTDYDLTDDFTTPVNKAVVLGSDGVSVDPLRRVRDNFFSQGLIQVRMGLDNEMSVSETGTLNDKGDAMLRKYSGALRTLDNMKLVRNSFPSIVDFTNGDVITFKDKEEGIEEPFRVFEWQATIGKDNDESLNLVVGDFALLGGMS